MKMFELNNGMTAEFTGLDEWSRPMMKYRRDGNVYHLVIVDNRMHATTKEGEPDFPLSDALQLKEYDFDFMKGEFVKKAEVSS